MKTTLEMLEERRMARKNHTALMLSSAKECKKVVQRKKKFSGLTNGDVFHPKFKTKERISQ